MRQLRRRRRQRRNIRRAVIGVLRLRQLPDYLANSRRSKTLALLMPSQPLPVLLTTFRHEVSTTNGRAAQTRLMDAVAKANAQHEKAAQRSW